MVKKSFWNAYDHLGACVLLNLLWSLLSLPWLAVAALMLMFGAGQLTAGRPLFGLMLATTGIEQLLISPISAGLWAVAAGWSDYRTATTRVFFASLRQLFLRSLGLWLLFTIAALVLAINAVFYHGLLGDVPILGAFAAALMGWAFLFICLLQVYALALLVRDRLPLKEILRRSALLVLDNIWYSVCLFLLISLILLIGLISVAGLLFLGVGLIAVIANTGLREILKKYQPQEGPERPKTWAQVREAEAGAEEEPRGWRDLWKPWAD
jgi:uncharacterized membrane protein YesL